MWAQIIPVVVLAGQAALAAPSDTLVLKTGSPTGSYQAVGGVIAGIIEREIPGVTVILSGSSGSVENVQALASKEADLAIAQNDIAFFADRGLEAFQGRPLRILRAIMALHPETVLVLGRKELRFRSAAAIRPGLRVVVGEAGSGTIANARDVLGVLGMPLSLVDTLMRPPRSSLGLLATDSADVIFLTAGVSDEFLLEVEENGGEVLGLSPELVAMLQRAHPYYSSGSVAVGDHSISTLQIRSLLLARAGLDQELVKRITEALLDNIAEVRAAHVRAQEILPGTVTQGVSILLHQGASEALCERGLASCDSPLGLMVILAILGGAAFLGLAFSAALRRVFLRNAPRAATALVGPRGVTSRYWYLSVVVIMSVFLLGGGWLVQVSEESYARAHNIRSDFEDLGLNENLLWMIVFTATGFEDGRFPRSPTAKLTSAAMNAVGISGFLFLFVLLTSDQLARRMKANMRIDPRTVTGHTIVCGWNRRGPGLVRSLTDKELGPRRQRLVICADLDEDPVAKHELDESWAAFSRGNPIDLEALKAAGLDSAEVLIVLSDEKAPLEDRDARALLTVVLAEKRAHELSTTPGGRRDHGIHTVVEVASPGNREALEKAHADQVICIQEFDEELLVQSVLNPGLRPLLEEILKTDEYNEAIEVPVRGTETPRFVGLSFDEALVEGRKREVLLMAIKRGGAEGWLRKQGRPPPRDKDATGLRRVLANPFGEKERGYTIQAGDSLIFLAESEKPLAKVFGHPGKWMGDLVG